MSMRSVVRDSCQALRQVVWPRPHAVLVRFTFGLLFLLCLGGCALGVRYLAVLARDFLVAQL